MAPRGVRLPLGGVVVADERHVQARRDDKLRPRQLPLAEEARSVVDDDRLRWSAAADDARRLDLTVADDRQVAAWSRDDLARSADDLAENRRILDQTRGRGHRRAGLRS